MSFLSLPDARILHIQGWGQRGDSNVKLRLEFAPKGELAVYRQGVFGEKKVLWLNMVYLELRTWTDTIQTGGGFMGGGFGVKGAAEGMLEASILNALTTRRREYALVGAFTYPPDGSSRRDIVFGFRQLSESDLRTAISAAVPKWAEEFVGHLLPELRKPATAEDITATYAELDGMLSRGMLTTDQHARLDAELAKHAPRPAPASVAPAAPDRIAQLKTLADLRASGALTAEEFEAEKARLLST